MLANAGTKKSATDLAGWSGTRSSAGAFAINPRKHVRAALNGFLLSAGNIAHIAKQFKIMFQWHRSENDRLLKFKFLLHDLCYLHWLYEHQQF